jgi:hypothetical protein
MRGVDQAGEAGVVAGLVGGVGVMEMKKYFACLLAAFLSLVGCVTVPLPQNKAVLVRGTIIVVRPAFTGWVLDWCVDAKPILLRDQQGSESCMPFGGEIYRARLVDGKIVGSGNIQARVKIGFPGHAYIPGYEVTDYFVLLPSPTNFRSDTGIQYVIGDVGNFDSVNACMMDRGYSHVGKYLCKDRSYHEVNYQHCVPLDEYLAHYSANP